MKQGKVQNEAKRYLAQEKGKIGICSELNHFLRDKNIININDMTHEISVMSFLLCFSFLLFYGTEPKVKPIDCGNVLCYLLKSVMKNVVPS